MEKKKIIKSVKNSRRKKSKATSTKEKRNLIISSLFEQTAKTGWSSVSLFTISESTGLSLSEVSNLFSSKHDILNSYINNIDKRIKEVSNTNDPNEPPRDKLFNVLMQRFDFLEPNKIAIMNIFKEIPKEPIQSLCRLKRFMNSMSIILNSADISTNGITGTLKINGLAAIYLNTLRIWLKDETKDMSKTMAALDKSLSQADNLAVILFKNE